MTRSRPFLEGAATLHAISLSEAPPSIIVEPDLQLPFPVGEVVDGCYRLDGLLGHGGMGVVYHAYDMELCRAVALKVNWPEIEPSLLLREARALSAFSHPGLIHPYASGTHGGVRYFAMELLHGTSLREYLHGLPRQRADIPIGAAIVSGIAETLTTLHAAGVVHRDIKPSNIMLVPPQRVVLLDFGLADLERFAHDHHRAASPHYVSPEVILEKVEIGDAHGADLYALGVVAFLVLTGRLPFEGDSTVEILNQHLDAPIPDVRHQRPEVSGHLSVLIIALLAKEPADRPSAETVLRELDGMELESKSTAYALAVLIVDDDPSLWDVLGYVLEDRGFNLVFADNGRSALQQLDRQPFDIVITDKNMPQLDGLELAREIQRRKLTTSVILMTAYPSEQVRAEAESAGVRSFVEKPFHIDQIAAVIDVVAREHQARLKEPA